MVIHGCTTLRRILSTWASVAAIAFLLIPGSAFSDLPDLIQRVKPSVVAVGNSGGPLLDSESGEVIGIINMVFVKGSKEAVLSQPSGISFAIPVNHLTQLLGK